MGTQKVKDFWYYHPCGDILSRKLVYQDPTHTPPHTHTHLCFSLTNRVCIFNTMAFLITILTSSPY